MHEKIYDFLKNIKYITWVVTFRCNLNCSYCSNVYLSKLFKEINYGIKLEIVEKLSNLNIKEIGITGGEPFLCNQFTEIVKRLIDYGIRVGINTNGTLIKEQFVNLLAKEKDYIDIIISLDAPLEYINDVFRGRGTFKKVLRTLKLLKKHEIPFSIASVVTKTNLNYVDSLCDFAYNIGSKGIVLTDLIPVGRAKNLKDIILNKKDYERLFEIIIKKNIQYMFNGRNDFKVKTTIPFIVPYILKYNKQLEQINTTRIKETFNLEKYCGMCISKIYMMPDGTILPCLYIPDPIGNILNTKLFIKKKIIYYRQVARESIGKCRFCKFQKICGGCPAMSYIYYMDLNHGDPRCWLFER